MVNGIQQKLPDLFERLMELRCFSETELRSTADGFYAAVVSVAELLARCGITTVPGSQGEVLECRLFFDDWYLYAISDGADYTYSLFKMREQEHDAKMGRYADGDIPGVTIPFIALRTDVLLACLQDPGQSNRKRLKEAINHVVSDRGCRHSDVLKGYFLRIETQGAYLIATLYTEYMAALAKDGWLQVPECYAAEYRKRGADGRLARFLAENNRAAGKVVCDHEKIYLDDPLHPTQWERLAILATHTGNTSFFSFAAEVQFHARFLTWWAKIPIPFVGRSPYASAIRADMSIGDAEFVGPTPYYWANSPIVKRQCACHKGDV